MGCRKDLTGQTFGYLKVVENLGIRKVGTQGTTRTFWKCQCICGSYTEQPTSKLTSRRGQVSSSCGCFGKYDSQGRKKCSQCKEFKNIVEFYEHDPNKSICKFCLRALRKQYHANLTTFEKRELSKKKYQKGREARLTYAKEYSLSHKVEKAQRKRDWDLRNPNYSKIRRKNLNIRIKDNLRGRLYKAVRGIGSVDTIEKLLNCSIEELKIHLASRFIGNMSWENYGQWHIDHIKPCDVFDLTKESEQRTCFHFSNLQPLWEFDNLSKGAKYESANSHSL